MPFSSSVIGIDIGGQRKGSHAVALKNGCFHRSLSTKSIDELIDWCRTTIDARVIAIDAPCRWSRDGRARPCERELMREGIQCFASTTRKKALAHPKNFYGWMLQGETLYQTLETTHPLVRKLPINDQPCCFETFPHAITWHLQGGHAKAGDKLADRRKLLRLANINHPEISNIDLVDAALCALTAHHLASDHACRAYGDADTGFIITPSGWHRDGITGSRNAPTS